MTNNFDRCDAVTLDFEGGNDNDPHDPGGRTSRGIEQREWDSYRRAHSGSSLPADVWQAPQSAIVDIYRSQYWMPVSGDQWPTGLDLCVYDAGVNSGISRALTWARAALGQTSGTFVLLASAAARRNDQTSLINSYQAKRLSFLEALSNWRYFGKGWGRRVAGIESIATKWAAQDAGHPPEIVAETLNKQAESASARAKAAGSGATVAPAAPAAHVTLVQHDSWLQYGIDAILIIGAVALVVWLAYQAYIHTVRAKAFAGAAK